MRKYSNIDFFNYPVFNGDLNDVAFKNGLLVTTINQYSYCVAEEDAEFKRALIDSDILLPDGIGVTVAARFLLGKKIDKIAGADIHKFLLEKLNKEHGSCFYLGASEATLRKIKERLSLDYPNLRVGTFSPPYKDNFANDEIAQMIQEVNYFNPDALFVGMTAPKQEKWAHKNGSQLNVGVICCIGAVFDFYAGTVNRPGEVWINLGLEWFGRLLKEPKRMWRRYVIYGFIFLRKIVGMKFSKRG